MGAALSGIFTQADSDDADQHKRKTRLDYSKGPFIPECEMAPEGTPLEQLYTDCSKRQGHSRFVPDKTFLTADRDNRLKLLRKMLPYYTFQGFGCRIGVQFTGPIIINEDKLNLIYKHISALSPITNKVVTNHTSLSRPDFFPGTDSPYPFSEYKNSEKRMIRSATGTLVTPLIPVSESCLLSNRNKTESQNNNYWLTLVLTATHAVCDLEEAKFSLFQFFYDHEDSIKNQEIRTLNGTDLTVSDYILHSKKYHQSNSGPDRHRLLHQVDIDLLSKLEMIAKYPFAGDMNVIVCKTDDEDTATCLSNAWNNWMNYRLSISPQSARFLIYKIRSLISHPHGGPKHVSIGHKFDITNVSVEECINNDNIFLERYYTEKGQVSNHWIRRYLVVSNTGNDLFPQNSHLYPPPPFDEDNNLVGDAKTVTIPARTEVVLPGLPETSYSLWRNETVPRKSLFFMFCFLPIYQEGSGSTSTLTYTLEVEDKRADTPINIVYKVASNTSVDLLPVGSRVFTPVALDKNHLVPDTDLVRLPAKTQVWIVEGLSLIKYSLRREIDVPADSLSIFGNLCLTYNTPTCPGSSGALIPDSFLTRFGIFSHSGACGDGKNKSGIRTY